MEHRYYARPRRDDGATHQLRGLWEHAPSAWAVDSPQTLCGRDLTSNWMVMTPDGALPANWTCWTCERHEFWVHPATERDRIEHGEQAVVTGGNVSGPSLTAQEVVDRLGNVLEPEDVIYAAEELGLKRKNTLVVRIDLSRARDTIQGSTPDELSWDVQQQVEQLFARANFCWWEGNSLPTRNEIGVEIEQEWSWSP